ncbi:MAG: rhodanese-like domain-containing protein [Prevotellaceae bacterium]|jgi:rhodanese-related sulfurtransferase|nr:rhodanese-like domain-containing protein [Prevotellaceae bacterium]
MSLFSSLFGSSSSPKVNLGSLIEAGAMVVDVRSEYEFAQGHLNNSTNIPLDRLPDELSKIDTAKPVIVCCATGMRSAQAKRYLKANEFAEVYNGGGWLDLQKYDK